MIVLNVPRSGYGDGDGYGNGYGYGNGNGDGYGDGYGYGYGDGDGNGYGYGYRYGYGSGSGNGSGDGYAYGSGYGFTGEPLLTAIALANHFDVMEKIQEHVGERTILAASIVSSEATALVRCKTRGHSTFKRKGKL